MLVAYLDLGFMLCKARRCGEAARGVRSRPAALRCDPLLHYNARSLECRGRLGEALSSYEACAQLQPDIAEAHHNAALLYA